MTKPFQWSYSGLDAFFNETTGCPRKFYNEKIARNYKQKRSAAGRFGSELHDKFEMRLKKGTALPLDLAHHEPLLAKLEAMGVDFLPEQKLAITRELKPTGFFDPDVWGRSVADLMGFKGDTCIVIDWKSGKHRHWDTTQIDYTFAVLSCYKPELTKFTGFYYWTKYKKVVPVQKTVQDLPEVWAKLTQQVTTVEKAIKSENFPPRPNMLCKRFCPVESCPHHGVG